MVKVIFKTACQGIIVQFCVFLFLNQDCGFFMWRIFVDLVKLETHIHDHLQNTVQHHLLEIVILAFSSSATLSNKIVPVSKQIMFDKVVTHQIFVNQTLSQCKQMIPLRNVFGYLTIYCKIHATNMQSLYRETQSFPPLHRLVETSHYLANGSDLL